MFLTRGYTQRNNSIARLLDLEFFRVVSLFSFRYTKKALFTKKKKKKKRKEEQHPMKDAGDQNKMLRVRLDETHSDQLRAAV